MKLILIANSEQTLYVVLVNYYSLLLMTMSRFSLEEYHFLNECNIIANNTEKNICGCIFSQKLTDIVHQPFSTTTTD